MQLLADTADAATFEVRRLTQVIAEKDAEIERLKGRL